MGAHITREDMYALVESIQADIQRWKARNMEDIQSIELKLNLLSSAITVGQAHESGVQLAHTSIRKKLGQQTPDSVRSINAERINSVLNSERKLASDGQAESLLNGAAQLSLNNICPDEQSEAGNVTLSAPQELFPKRMEGEALALADLKGATADAEAAIDATYIPCTPKPQRSAGHEFSKTPFSQTPFSRTPYSASKQRMSSSPTMAIDSILPMQNIREFTSLCLTYQNGRPVVSPVEELESNAALKPQNEMLPGTSCQVLVEFKRNRVYQYDSPFVILPGKHAIVSGDRGDDLGLVLFSWFTTKHGVEASGIPGASEGKQIGLGIGKVVRAATEVEVSVVHNVLKDLEVQALEVCRARVRDLGIPMFVHDAEYQYDRKWRCIKLRAHRNNVGHTRNNIGHTEKT